MKPETYEKWEKALSSFANAEELWRDSKSEEAAREVEAAVFLACAAIMNLSDELKTPYLSKRAEHYITKWSNRMKRKEYLAPKQAIEEVRRILQRLSDELPRDTFRLFS